MYYVDMAVLDIVQNAYKKRKVSLAVVVEACGNHLRKKISSL